MYVGPTQLLWDTVYGETSPSNMAEANMYETLAAALAGTFDFLSVYRK